MRPVNPHTAAPQSSSPATGNPAQDATASVAPAAPPDDADTLRLDLEFDFSRFRFRRVLFSKISDSERAASLKTRLFGGLMASTATQWVKNYIRANIDVKNAGEPVQHMLRQSRVSGRDFKEMVQQTRRCGLNRDVGLSSESREPSFLDFTPRLSGSSLKPEEINLSRSREFLWTISSAAQFGLLTPSVVETISGNIDAVDGARDDPSLVKQLKDLVSDADQWRKMRAAGEWGVPTEFEAALVQLERLINELAYERPVGPTRSDRVEKHVATLDGIFGALRDHCNVLPSELKRPQLVPILLDEKFIAYCRTRDASLIEHPISAELLTIVHLKDKWLSMLGFLEKVEQTQLMRWIELLSEDVARSGRGQPLLRQTSEPALSRREAETGGQLVMKMRQIQLTEAMRPFREIVSFVWDPAFHAYLDSGTLDDLTDQDIEHLREMAVQFDVELLDELVSRGSPYVREGGLSDKERQMLRKHCAELRHLLKISSR